MFNTYFALVQVKIEHCICMLKGCFQSLRCLQMQLLTKQDHIQVVLWVRACAILQNLLFNDYYDREWNDVHDFNDSETNQDEM